MFLSLYYTIFFLRLYNKRIFFPDNIYSFFSISLHACYTDKMRILKPGDTLMAYCLAYIQNELILFEAMDYLAGSRLAEAILRPEPHHFPLIDPKSSISLNSQVSEEKILVFN